MPLLTSLPERSILILLSVGAAALVLFLMQIATLSRSKKLSLTIGLLSVGLVFVAISFTFILYEALYPLF